MNLNQRQVRDYFWMWGHQEGSHNRAVHSAGTSRMTPMEAALYLDIPNAMMVGYGGQPEPPFNQYAKSLVGLRNLVWSIVGDGSSKRNDHQSDLDEVIALSEEFPNIVGGLLDDFFQIPDDKGKFSRYDLAAMHHFRDKLHGAPRPLDLYIVLYDHDLNTPLGDFLKAADIVTFWTWKADQLPHLEQNLSRAEGLIGNKKKMIGCYLWDYGAQKPIPLELMQYQCENGLRWLKEGRIDGMVFLASCICDLDLETVEWTREWIKKVGYSPLSLK